MAKDPFMLLAINSQQRPLANVCGAVLKKGLNLSFTSFFTSTKKSEDIVMLVI